VSSSGISGSSAARPKQGRKPMHFLVSLCIAVIIWLFKSLSAAYNSEIPVELQYEFPEKSTAVNPLPDRALIFVTTTGWQLLREKFYKRQVTIHFDQFEGNHLITNDNRDLFASDLPPAFTVVHISPDTIQFQIEGYISKRVPVLLNQNISFKPAFMISDTVKLLPDSILISGPRSTIDSIDSWKTEMLTRAEADSTLNGVIALESRGNKNISLSAIAVSFHIPIAHFDTTRVDSAFINLQEK
jgi:hypothetical protein